MYSCFLSCSNPNAADSEGKTPLHYVASSKASLSSHLIGQLLHHGSDVGTITCSFVDVTRVKHSEVLKLTHCFLKVMILHYGRSLRHRDLSAVHCLNYLAQIQNGPTSHKVDKCFNLSIFDRGLPNDCYVFGHDFCIKIFSSAHTFCALLCTLKHTFRAIIMYLKTNLRHTFGAIISVSHFETLQITDKVRFKNPT